MSTTPNRPSIARIGPIDSDHPFYEEDAHKWLKDHGWSPVEPDPSRQRIRNTVVLPDTNTEWTKTFDSKVEADKGVEDALTAMGGLILKHRIVPPNGFVL